MMRSLYSGVSGLKTHQTRMDVVGNNIANVNTAGYKKSRVVFADAFYQNLKGASSPNDARGGINPMKVGLGVRLASIDQIHTPAPTNTTGKNSDVAVDGNGYFVLENGNQLFYSRAGNFDLDELGNFISQSNGYRVMGWVADKNGDINTVAAMTNIDLSGFKTIAPVATTQIAFSGNLNSNTAMGYKVDAAGNPTGPFLPGDPIADYKGGEVIPTQKITYDSKGNKVVLYYNFFRAAGTVDPSTDPPTLSDPQWYCDISLDPAFAGTVVGYDPADPDTHKLVDVTLANQTVRLSNISFTDKGVLISPKNIDITIDRTAAEAENMAINIDFSAMTEWEAKSKPFPYYADGYAMGSLISYTIGVDGIISGTYDNGVDLDLARIGLANFQNPSGLQQVGGNMFQVSKNSGDPLYGAPEEGGLGALIPGSLEMSNVDLSDEFVDMIVTQRGFQANSRIITTSDEMLQELLNLKR